MFQPMHTSRLVIRPLQTDDAGDLAERRSDPRVARYQSWALPYPPARAQQLVDRVVAMDGPQDEAWWMAAIVEADGRASVGDVAVHLTSEGRTAEIGYTLSPDHWGRGFATEAVEAMVEYLFDGFGVTRVFGMIHPDNVASARVLERCGLVYEGQTRRSYWVGDECTDDRLYGMTRPDWVAWRDRPRTPPDLVKLVDIDAANYETVLSLRTHKSEETFVAPTGKSFADALFPEEIDGAPVVPWMRAIEADGAITGFVMLAATTLHHPEPFLWRFLVDRMHQRRGVGSRAMDLVESACHAVGDTALLTSWVPGRGSPGAFYLKRGFVPTGRMVDGEIEARKQLTATGWEAVVPPAGTDRRVPGGDPSRGLQGG
jgi:RimJ/RimL family protein N-acetyltransferase